MSIKLLPKLQVFLFPFAFCASGLAAVPSHSHVVVIAWDGMRPDFVTKENCPNLYELSREGVTFAHHHSCYPSATEVNGTAISTGGYPGHTGIVGNHEYRPQIEPLKSVHTEALESVRKGDELTGGRYVGLPTLAEIVRHAGRRAAVAGAKPVALLADRNAPLADGRNVYGGSALPSSLLQVLTNRYGEYPPEDATSPTRNDWTTDALLEPLWGRDVPDFTFLWLNEPDASQHRAGPGSAAALAGIRNSDENLGRVLKALESRGMRKTTDILVVSDHGCSTIASRADVAAALEGAGIKAVRSFNDKPKPGEVLVVSNSGSSLIYVIGHDEKVIQRIVRFLQGWEFTGVIFTRKAMPGTFALSQVHADSASAPDVMMSLRWMDEPNKTGVRGMIYADASPYGPTQGSHVSLSRYDMHATLVAAGPHFRQNVVSTLASGNVDIAPTVLWLMGITPLKLMDGRVLTEALAIKGPAIKSFEPRGLEAGAERGGSVWRQYLLTTEVNGVSYYDEGNGEVVKSR